MERKKIKFDSIRERKIEYQKHILKNKIKNKKNSLVLS